MSKVWEEYKEFCEVNQLSECNLEHLDYFIACNYQRIFKIENKNSFLEKYSL